MTSCHDHCNSNEQPNVSAEYRKVLWICLVANAVMFVAQMVASYAAHSVSLLANSADFFSDAANYGISLYVLNKSLHQKAKASLFKGFTLGLVGLLARILVVQIQLIEIFSLLFHRFPVLRYR